MITRVSLDLDRKWRSVSEILPIIAADNCVLVIIDLRVPAATRHGTRLRGHRRRQAVDDAPARGPLDGRARERYDQIRIAVVGLLQDGAGGSPSSALRRWAR
jgi:hypothetical protein